MSPGHQTQPAARPPLPAERRRRRNQDIEGGHHDVPIPDSAQDSPAGTAVGKAAAGLTARGWLNVVCLAVSVAKARPS